MKIIKYIRGQMRRSIIIWILLVLSALNYAQKEPDSLLNQIMEYEAQDIVNADYTDLLLEYGKQFLYTQPDKTIEFGEKALVFARDLKDKKLESKSLATIGSANIMNGEYEVAKIDFLKRALLLAEETHYLQGMSTALNGLASVEMIKGDYDSALTLFERSANIEKERGDSLRVATIQFNMAGLLMNQGKYDDALDYYLTSLRIFEKFDDKTLVTRAMNNIAVLYHAWGNFDKALEYYQRSADEYLRSADSLGVAIPYNNIGEIYKDMGDFEKAVEYYSDSNRLSLKFDNKQYIGVSAQGLGEAYRGLKEYNKSLMNLELALETFKQIKFQEGIARTLSIIAGVNFETKKYSEAISALDESQEIAKNTGIKDLIQANDLLFSRIYEKIGEYKLALKYFQDYSTVKDTLFSEENSKKIAEMDAKYETEKKEKENILLRKNNEIKELRIQKQMTRIFYLLAVLVLVIFLIVLLLRRYRHKQKMNDILREKNTQISTQRDQLAKTLNELKETQERLLEAKKMASLGNLVTGIAHEINTPVGIGITAISTVKDKTLKIVQNYRENSMKRKDLEEFFKVLHQSINLILKNLQRAADLVTSFKQVSIDQSTEHKRLFNIKNYLDEIVFSLGPQLEEKKIEIETDIDEKIEINSLPGAFASIFTNLLINSKIHGFIGREECKIKIESKLIGDKLVMNYSDNGVGISKDNLSKIFDPFFTTNKQLGTGLGLNIAYNMVTQKLHGTIDCQSVLGEGVKFTIRIPMSDIGDKNE